MKRILAAAVLFIPSAIIAGDNGYKVTYAETKAGTDMLAGLEGITGKKAVDSDGLHYEESIPNV